MAAQGKLGGFAQRLAAARAAAARSADDAVGTGEVPLKDAEKAALEAALGQNEIQGKDAEAAQQKLREESAATQPSLERVMEELDMAEVGKLEQACKARRTALEQQELLRKAGALKQPELLSKDGAEHVLKLMHPVLASFLTERFRKVAPEYAVAKYMHHVSSSAMLLGGLPQLGSDELLVEHLVLVVDRKEVDLQGMAQHAATPSGFRRGVGSPAGNNCFISSVCQSLQGVPSEGPLHEELCRNIRAAGVGTLWAQNNYIEASTSTLQFIAGNLLVAVSNVTCWVYSSYDGSNITKVACGSAELP